MNAKKLIYKDTSIHVREDNLISLSDLWKANGKVKAESPSIWIRKDDSQNKFFHIAIETGVTPKISSDGSILGVPGVLEAVRGGNSASQGTFGDVECVIAYAGFLSDECKLWAKKSLLNQARVEDLPPELVFSMMQSEKEFPVDFDDAWQWVGYSKKSDAKAALTRNFEKDLDYSFCGDNRKNLQSKTLGRKKEKIYLTIDCFKGFCLMAETKRGKQVRKYFIECEKAFREILKRREQKWRTYGIDLLVSEGYTAWQKRFEDEFFEEAYRVMGWQRTKSGHPPCMGGFINKVVYDKFPDGVVDRLKTVNPKVKGSRKRKHHQHLNPPGLRGLDAQKGAALAVLRLTPSNSPSSFRRNLKVALGEDIQLRLPIVDDDIA